MSRSYSIGGNKEFKPAPTGMPPIVHPPTIHLDGLGVGLMTRLWIQPTARRPCPLGHEV